ncbi:ABC transporter ATP-binding protein [Bacterioplanoides sp. SCSIO 12839]|uniref:ABC transporter ATP-binding protein n=1 Tax=Bacterioplanoides sp. SCSIO 12839 TaxID=2829569 RepID=UPI002104F1E3|nr:ABC transporter ATP-binding protein [Bacterioplanoides sp. SCSIO 12839]UTW47459.1 ABC transporter ATP-binding protein [Bacterioplanoides sp. SCSIO 12839]
MIKVEQLTKRFGGITAVDQLSFQVMPGEVLGFLGPNGAGKSTTMKMITGFLEPDFGSVEIFGADIVKAPLQAKQQIGYLPEGAPAYGDMTVLAFLRFMAEIRGFSGSELSNRVAAVVDKTELREVLKQPVETLSKGFKRRVGLAQTLIHDPAVLILDEPTDGLDPNQKQQVRDLITHLSDDKIVIVSTHILEEVTSVCSRAMIIAQGKKVIDGTPQELEARSRYHQAISLSFSEPVAQAASALAALDGVMEVDETQNGRHYLLFPEPGVALYPQVNTLINQQQWPIDTLHIERGRLDDVFRSLTIADHDQTDMAVK